MIEGRLWSDEYKIAGTVDLIADWDGILSAIDWKTSLKHVNDDHPKLEKYKIQGTAYAKMFEEIYPGKKIEQTLVLASCEDGFVQEWLHSESDIKKHQELFYKHATDFFNLHKDSLAKIS